MTVSAVTLAPGPVTGPGTGAFAEIANPTLRELADRASRPDYDRWLASTAAAGGCRRPVRLRGEVHDVDVRTGEILTSFHTTAEPDGVIYKACGDRRASVCPACAEIYRRDAYQLVRAGMAGGKGEVPESVRAPVRVRHLHRAVVRPGAYPAEPPRQADQGRVVPRGTRARRLQGAPPLGAHARLPWPLHHQIPPLLRHLQNCCAPRGPTGGAASTAPPTTWPRRRRSPWACCPTPVAAGAPMETRA